MDGVKRVMTRSLQWRLSIWLAVVILGFAVVAGVSTFLEALGEANELQDSQLREIAALVHRYHLPVGRIQPPTDVPGTDFDARVIVRALTPGPSAEKVEKPEFAYDIKNGFHTVHVDGDDWRVFVSPALDGQPRLLIGQQTKTRNDVARASAISAVLPFVALVPVLLALVGWLVRQMLRPVRQLAADVNARRDGNMEALRGPAVPAEIAPFVRAINRLLLRVARSVAQQRQFVADAAHELRSPLTALSLQAELLDSADMSARARERLGTLRLGLERARVLVEQLLTLARAQDAGPRPALQLPLQRVLHDVIEDMITLADRKHIDLGITESADASVWVPEFELKVLVRNLVENAVRYTPDGGRVDLSVRAGARGPILCVEDTGPGIPPGERERVFDPFYRSLGHDEQGSGLGLSIVATIARRIGVTVELDPSDEPKHTTGLCVVVRFTTPSNG